jgi:hypothetical protein
MSKYIGLFYYESFNLNELPVPLIPKTESVKNISKIENLESSKCYSKNIKGDDVIAGKATLKANITYNKEKSSYTYFVEIDVIVPDTKLRALYAYDLLNHKYKVTENNLIPGTIFPIIAEFIFDKNPIINIQNLSFKFGYDNSTNQILESFYFETFSPVPPLPPVNL